MKLAAGALPAALVILGCVTDASALSWRLFVGRDDCVSEWLPQSQYDKLKESHESRKQRMPDELNVVVDAGFLLRNRYGGETSKASVDVWVKNPEDRVVYRKANTKEDNFYIHAKGGIGPWQLCFRVNQRDSAHQHALTVELTFFTINLRVLVGTDHEWVKGAPTIDPSTVGLDIDTLDLPTDSDITHLKKALQQLDTHLVQITHEQRYLQQRADRHMKTVKSTHFRTLAWSFAQAVAIAGASLAQVLTVQYLFKSSRKTYSV
ncbi:unnamed protein product [Ostreobium quekettii]|uniref:GOLD domain-containing protein n=1 Tax=Ostreobium quekettii TaxID=121088 RepID=A0A8S1IYZ2_9CHLO|nr:unnamed protein product [Ostreobium quekettii]|eukprot:evm.model.scf_37.16 EVM.evm.TU.scf_37.16   scf_37:132343-136477(+)